MNRRNFLTRSGLALGALIVGDEVLEAMDRLTHRKVFALGAMPKAHNGPYGVLYVREHADAPWVEHDRAPLVDARVTFGKVVPAQYTESRYALIVPEAMPTITAHLYLDASAVPARPSS